MCSNRADVIHETRVLSLSLGIFSAILCRSHGEGEEAHPRLYVGSSLEDREREKRSGQRDRHLVKDAQSHRLSRDSQKTCINESFLHHTGVHSFQGGELWEPSDMPHKSRGNVLHRKNVYAASKPAWSAPIRFGAR